MHVAHLAGFIAVPILVAAFSPRPARATAEDRPGWGDETSAGIVITGGNASSESYALRQANHYAWGENLVRFEGRYLETRSRDLESARYWLLGLRYDRALAVGGDLGAFAGEGVESDVFAAYSQRYATDVGARYFPVRDNERYLSVEAGYRYLIENRLNGQLDQHLLRFYAESGRDWTNTFSTRVSVEYLPDLTIASDYLLNVELSMQAMISPTFALRLTYLDRFRNLPIPPATAQTDTQFITAVVAKL